MRPVHIATAIAVAAIWGFNFVVIKVGLDHYPPILFSGLRFAFAAIPLVFFVPRPKIPWSILGGIGFFIGIVQFTLLFLGMKAGLSPGLASLVIQSQVFFTTILAMVFLGDRMTRVQIIGMGVAFCGIALIGIFQDAHVTLIGLALVIGAALSWSVANILMKKAGNVDMLHVMVHASLVVPIPLIFLSLLVEGRDTVVASLMAVTWEGFWVLLFNGWIVTVVGFGLWGMLIRRYGASQVVPFALLVPVFGMSSSALLLGESFGPMRLVAATLVIVGLVLTVMKRLPFPVSKRS
jgi:O-acetylserine/cysteine efflux transporter